MVNVFMGRFKKLGFIEEGGGRLFVKPSLMHLVAEDYMLRSAYTADQMTESSATP